MKKDLLTISTKLEEKNNLSQKRKFLGLFVKN